MRNIILTLSFIVLLCSCQHKQSYENAFITDDIAMEEEMIPVTRQQGIEPPPPPLVPKKNHEIIKKKIIKDGRIGLEVNVIEATKTRIDSLVKKYNGYYAHEDLNNTDWEITYNLKIRIPSKHFELLINNLAIGGGKIEYKEISARDVTEQFIDLETRVANKKNYFKRYNELLSQAKTVKDILEIQENIRVIEEEIDSYSGRLKYLQDLVDYSTLDLEIREPKNVKSQPAEREKFTTRIIEALSLGWFGFLDFIVFIVNLWPLGIIITLLILAWKKFRKLKENKK